ncbi:MAG TPA: GIY-YIG nuclease family protein [Candidatus Methanomethylophilaceae archaeon]|nr:GIY-YIG nuclease family protein [Candidatus Methanomethylophilaceae archaeon]
MSSDIELNVGSLGSIAFKAGEYCYVGSAMNGLEHRIKRHISREKTIRWHIDRLTINADSIKAYISEGENIVPECTIADTAKKIGLLPFVKGFGSSDCVCYTHLFSVMPGKREALISTLGLELLEPL